MEKVNIYVSLWEKYRPAIVSQMRSAINDTQVYQLSGHEFKDLGVRVSSGFSFNLELNKGVLINNIDKTAVARDLFIVLNKSKSACELMKENYFKISLAKDFKLTIQVITD